MRKWILRIHLYGGLICAPYLIIFGLTSIHYNHRERGPRAPLPVVAEWQAPLTVEAVKENEAMANSVRDSVGLIGWVFPAKIKRDEAGNLQFDVERPGKGYTVRADVKDRTVKVEERHKGFVQVFDALHAFRGVPNSPFTASWGIYTEVCTIFALFATVSGIYLWVNSERERRVGLAIVVAATVISLGAMIFVVLRG